MAVTKSPWKKTQVFGKYLGYYEPVMIPSTDTDTYMTLKNPEFVHRPDKLSNLIYSTPEYWWVFGKVNNWKDPIYDMELGIKFLVPSPDSIRRIN